MNFYRPQTKLQKGNVFTSVCQEFCPQLGGEVYNPWADSPQADTPRVDGYCSGRYASYWNAFLSRIFIHTLSLARLASNLSCIRRVLASAEAYSTVNSFVFNNYKLHWVLNIGSIRIYILTTGVVSNETNTYVRMYIEEFILVEIWIHWS